MASTTKLDVDLEIDEGAASGAAATKSSLKAGSIVQLHLDEASGRLECRCCPDGAADGESQVLLGRVPEQQARRVGPLPGAWKASVRSIKRAAADSGGGVTSIQVRLALLRGGGGGEECGVLSVPLQRPGAVVREVLRALEGGGGGGGRGGTLEYVS